MEANLRMCHDVIQHKTKIFLPMEHFLDFSKDANIKANIRVVNNDDNEGN